MAGLQRSLVLAIFLLLGLVALTIFHDLGQERGCALPGVDSRWILDAAPVPVLSRSHER